MVSLFKFCISCIVIQKPPEFRYDIYLLYHTNPQNSIEMILDMKKEQSALELSPIPNMS